MKQSAVAWLLVGTLAGCAGPAVKTAVVAPVPPATGWRTDAGPTAPMDAHWWQSFGDPVLSALVEKAIANNTDIAIASARVREARANVAFARAQLLPTFDAGAAGGRSRSVSGIGTPLNQTFAQPQVQANYELDLFGRLADSESAARSAYLGSQAARDSVRLAVTGATASQYILLLGLDARLDVARQTLASRADSIRIARRRDDAGYSPKLELQQALAEYDATAQIIPQLETAIAKVENSLSQLVGDPPGAIQRGGSLGQLIAPSVPDGLPSLLLDQRPDIAQAADQLAATDASLASARKRFLPQLRLGVSGGAAFSTAIADPITLWSIGGSVLAPLFEGERLRAQVDVAVSRRDQAAFAYRLTVLTSFREVEDAMASVRHLDEQLVLARHQRTVLAEALRLATNRYREGYSAYLEQLDAQRGLLNVELAVANLDSDALSARVQLFQAMGGGWNAAVQSVARLPITGRSEKGHP